MKSKLHNPAFWSGPVKTIQLFLEDPNSLRLDKLTWTGEQPQQRSAFHHLMQIVRNRSLIVHLVQNQTKRPPKPKLRAVLALGIVQLLESPEASAEATINHAKIVHHTVDIARKLCSPQEAKFVNAVCRCISRTLKEQLKGLDQPKTWHILYSHPNWLIDRWAEQFGLETTKSILQWNQQIPETYLHDINGLLDNLPPEERSNKASECGLQPSQWPGFFRVEKSGRQHLQTLLKDPFYIQDPSTAVAPALFSTSKTPHDLLDACASPGGKSVHFYKHFENTKESPLRWIAADLSEERLELFENNMKRLGISGISTCVVDWEKDIPGSLQDQTFDWILLDAPCTSVGVIQKHPEIRWRLSPMDYTQVPARQLKILSHCSKLLKPGGELVYSTCSFDTEENKDVINAFLESADGSDFEVAQRTLLLPHMEKHDGVGATLLRRK